MDRRSTSPGRRRWAARLEGRAEAAAARADWSCSTPRMRWRSAQRPQRSRRASDARSGLNRTRAVSRVDPRRGLLLEPWMHARRRWHGEVRRLEDQWASRGGHRRPRDASIAPRWWSSGYGDRRPGDGVDNIAVVAPRVPGCRRRRAPRRAGRVRGARRCRARGSGTSALRSDGCELRPVGGRRRDLRPDRRGGRQRRSTRLRAERGLSIGLGDARAEDDLPGRLARPARDRRRPAPSDNPTLRRVARAVRTLYRAARVHTLSHPRTGEWLLVDDRHVQRVGTGDPPQADRLVELPGATIVPGFIDTHVHLTSTGESLANADVHATAPRRSCSSWPGPGPPRRGPGAPSGLRRDAVERSVAPHSGGTR